MVRLKDIADVAGVTPATVSAALSGRGRIGAETREQIIRIASELNYQPNTAAQLLKNKPIVDIGFLIADGQTDAMPAFIQRCEDQNLSHQLELISSSIPANRKPALLQERRAEGVLHTGFIGDGVLDFLKRNPDYPFVAIDENSAHCVRADFEHGARRALEHLAGLGHRRIAMSYGFLGYDIHRQLKRGLEAAIVEFGLEQGGVFAPYEVASKETREAMALSIVWAEKLLSAPVRPTAVFCAGIHTARAVVHAALTRGLRVPEDLSVIAIGTPFNAECGIPALTTVERDYEAMVDRAMELLRRRIDGTAEATEDIRVATKLVHRSSVSTPRKG